MAYLIAFLCILFLYLLRKSKKPSAAITNWPIVGMLPSILSNVSRLHDYGTDVLEKEETSTIIVNGPWLTNSDVIVTSDAENFHYILSRNFQNFQRGDSFKKIFDVLGDGLIIAESDSWKAQRKRTHALFKDRDFLIFLEKTVQEKVENGLFVVLDDASKQAIEIDMHDLLHRLIFDVTCTFLYGFDARSLSPESPNVSKAIDEFEEGAFRRFIMPELIWKLQEWLQMGDARKAHLARKSLDEFIYHNIHLKREHLNRELEKQHGHDLVTRFIKEDESFSTNTMSDHFLRDSIINLIIAGRDTTSLALSWFFWLLSQNPDAENKIREEMKQQFHLHEGERWSFFTYEKINNLVYLHAALSETLRLYPPIPFFLTAAVEPVVLPSGHRVDKDTNIVCSFYAMGRTGKIWGEDCAKFKPERWISERGEILHFPSNKFVTFSAGPRTCVGKDLAFMEMKIIATAVLWNYHLQAVEGHPILPSSSVVLRMKHGLKVKVVKRYQ